jgi:uridine kinase
MTQQPASVYPGADLAALADLVRERPHTLGTSRLVCIDGPAGAGKTTLAAELQQLMTRQALSVASLHMDDFYEGWSGIDRASQLEPRLLDQVLRPLATGRPGRWQRYDWAAGQFAEWLELPVPDVLIIEGCGSGALAYAAYITVLVWVEAEPSTRIARGVERDSEAVLPQWLRWMDSEARHFAANGTRGRADVLLSTG